MKRTQFFQQFLYKYFRQFASLTRKILITFSYLCSCGNKHFIYYSADDVSNSCAKTYRNIYERVLDKEMNPKVRHAHSYDFDAQQQHRRIINPGDNKCLRQDYHSLNKSIYLERKHHFTYCKIAGKNKYFNATSINVTLLFRPQKTHFQHNQYLEDYLFIDVSKIAILNNNFLNFNLPIF